MLAICGELYFSIVSVHQYNNFRFRWCKYAFGFLKYRGRNEPR